MGLGTKTGIMSLAGNAFSSIYSFLFDGVDDYISIPQTTYDSEFTTSFCIKPGSVGTSFLAGREANSDYIWLRTTTQIRLRINFSTYSFIEGGSNTINIGAWNHLLISRDSSNNVSIFLNGASFSTSQVGAGDHRLDQIGKVTTGYYDGNIDEVAFWSTDESANLNTIYNGGIPNNLNDNGLTLPTTWYRMGEEATFDGIRDWTLVDQGSNRNDDTSLNMAEDQRVTDVPT